MNNITKIAIAAFVAAPLIVYSVKYFGAEKGEHNAGVSAVADSGMSADKLFASKCASCHGQNGEGADTYPKLSGMDKAQFIAKIAKHSSVQNSGANPVMNSQVSSLSPKDVEALAEYVAALKPTDSATKDGNTTAKKQELKLEKGGGGD